MDRKTIPAEAAMADGRPFVGMEHVDPATGAIGSGAGSRTGEGKGQAFLFDERHVLFGKLRPYLRKIALPEIKGCSSTELVPLLPNPKRLDRAYLFHWVRRDPVIAALMGKNIGARMPRADMSVLMDMSIPLPPLEDQRRIVAVLDRAAAIRRRADAARTQARALIPALFLDMFGDPATNPKGWDTTTIDTLAAYTRYGPRFPDRPYSDTGAHILRTSDMGFDGSLRWQDSPILPATADEISKYQLLKGTILITRTGATIGKVALFKGSDRPCIAGAYLIELGLREDVRAEFVVQLLMSSYGQNCLVRGSRAVAQPNINAPTIRAISVPLPPLPFQTAFAEQAARIEAGARALDAAAAKAEALAAALSAEVFG